MPPDWETAVERLEISARARGDFEAADFLRQLVDSARAGTKRFSCTVPGRTGIWPIPGVCLGGLLNEFERAALEAQAGRRRYLATLGIGLGAEAAGGK